LSPAGLPLCFVLFFMNVSFRAMLHLAGGMSTAAALDTAKHPANLAVRHATSCDEVRLLEIVFLKEDFFFSTT
jgi:hypothetical protein